MAGMSKNSRVSRSGSTNTRAQSGEARLIVPLNHGLHAYVSVDHKTRHVATDSEAFLAALTDLGSDKAEKVRNELEDLNKAHPNDGWDKTLTRAVEAGAL